MIGSFTWHEARRQLTELAGARALVSDGRGAFAGAGLRFVPPAVLSPIADTDTPASWLARLPEDPGTWLVVLLRAGSASLGLFECDTCVAHKVFRRYVVRGHGKAQPAHAKTKGKSRYGSRLRLQNAKRLLEEVNERLTDWVAAAPTLAAVHWSCPVRQWPELFAATPPPPFPRDDPRLRRIAMHVHEPDHDELLRVARSLSRGRVEHGPGDPGRPTMADPGRNRRS